jgi:hypothetical protein
LYPPFNSPAFQWDHNDHNQIMTVTVSFCWHIMLIMSGLLIQLFLIKKFYQKSKKISKIYDEIIEIDDIDPETGIYFKNGNEAKFFSLVSDDDEHIEYDNQKLLESDDKKPKYDELNMINKFKDYQNSGSSSTSGVASANTSI